MEEQLIVCDEYGNEQYQEARSLVHQKGLWHKVIHVWIYQGDFLYLQQRAMTKKAFPGGYDITVAGHMDPQETSVQTACRECMEELGIRLHPELLHRIGTFQEIMYHQKAIDREVAEVYIYNDFITSYTLGEEVIALGTISIKEFTQMLNGIRSTCSFHPLHGSHDIILQEEELLLHKRSYYEWILQSLH